jgi:hypothetical protein
LVTDEASSFCRIVVAGFRTLNAVWLAPVLLFVILAPQQTGFCAEMLALRSSGGQFPPWLIVAVITGHLSILWFPVLMLSFPWVMGGAAAEFRDQRIPSESRRTYFERANEFYGRSLALWMPVGIALAALLIALYAIPLGFKIRDQLSMAAPVGTPILLTLHPSMIALAMTYWLLAAVIVVAGTLILAAMVLEDIGLRQAVRRSFAFVVNHPADAARLWLFVALLGVPNVLLQHAIFLVPITPAALVAIATTLTVYAAYAVMLIVAVVESVYVARGQGGAQTGGR